MTKKLLLSLLFIVSICLNSYSQSSLSAEIRPRTEYRDGFKTPKQEGDQAAFFTEQRTRLNFNYVDTLFDFRVSLQDIRIWGETSQIFKQENGNTFLSEAWFKYKVSSDWAIKAGRQIISYDNQRYLGGLEWAQQGRRHDALLFINSNNLAQSRLEIGLAFNSDDDIPEPQNIQSATASFYSKNNYKYMQYAWFNKKFTNVKLSFLAMNLGFQDNEENVSFRQTIGSYGKTTKSNFNIGYDLYYQMGKQAENKVNAFLAGINFTLKTSSTPITLGIEYISGKNGDDASSDRRHFTPDFGTNHAHNGYMDYFFVGPSNGNVGVKDIYLKTKLNIKKSKLGINVHQFFTGSKQFDVNNLELSKSLGSELDLVLTIPIRKDANFKMGYSFLIASETMKTIRARNGEFNSWAWMMFTIKPELWKDK